MPESKSFMEVLTESLDQWATKFAGQDGPAGQPSLGARMQEMEREIAILTESRDKLADGLTEAQAKIKFHEKSIELLTNHRDKLAAELRERDRACAAVEADRDLWKQDATDRGLELQDAWRAFPESIRWARAGKDSLPLTIEKFCEQWLADKELTTAATEEERKWEIQWGDLRAILIGHGIGIDDDAPADLIEKLSEAIADLPVLRSRVRSQQESIAKLQSDLRLAQEDLAQLRTIHHEWVNGQREKPVGLNETLQRMNDVITMQIEALSPTKGTGKTVDIRRRMLAKYSIQHDAEHLDDNHLLDAARALISGEFGLWPWSTEMLNEVIASLEMLPTAAALIIAHYDAAQTKECPA